MEVIERFKQYVSSFYCIDEYLNKNFRIKEKHSVRVFKNMCSLSKDIGLDDRNLNICKYIGLFHDIGRFEQFKKFRTFNDKVTGDHARIGIDVIKRENILKNIPESDHKKILSPVYYHNKKELFKSTLDPDIILFSKMIRDADKTDILSIISSHIENNIDCNPALFLDLPDHPVPTPEIYRTFLSEKRIDSKKIRNRTDFILLLSSWTFDINFNLTKKMIRDNQYLQKILYSLSDSEVKKRSLEIIGKFLD